MAGPGPATRLLGAADVERLLDLDLLIDRLARAFAELSRGEASVPPRTAALTPGGLLGAMPGYAPSAGLAAKLVSVFAANHDAGLPSHQALIAVFDPATGSPLAVMDGTAITALRTAAGSALSTRLLARADARVLAIIGAGVQGGAHLRLLQRAGGFETVRVASRNREHAAALARLDARAVVAESFEAAVRGADVVCCCTDAAAPVLDAGWVSEGAHVTSVGANTRGGELPPALLDRADVLCVESRVAFSPPPAGSYELLGRDSTAAVEIGELVLGVATGRRSASDVTVYKSMGHAVEDAVAARLVSEAAEREGAGLEFRFQQT